MHILLQTSLIAGVISLIFGFITFFKTQKSKTAFSFVLLCLVVGVWEISFFLEKNTSGFFWNKIYLFATILLGPAFLYFNLLYLRFFDEEVKRNSTIYFAIGVFLIMGCFVPAEQLKFFTNVALFYFGIALFSVLYLLFQNLKKSKTKSEYTRIKYLFIGSAIVVGTIIGDFLSKFGIPFPTLGNIVLLLYLYFLFQSLTQERPLNIEEYLSKGVLFIILSLILTIIYLVLVSYVKESKGVFIFNTFCASFIILILYEPSKKIAEKLTKKIIYKELYQMENNIYKLKENLLGVIEFKNLEDFLIHFLRISLKATHFHIYLLDKEKHLYEKKASSHEENYLPHLLESHPLLDFILKQKGAPLTLTEFQEKKNKNNLKIQTLEKINTTIEVFNKLNTEVLIPFYYQGHILGFAFAGNQNSTESYSPSMLSLLSSITNDLGLVALHLSRNTTGFVPIEMKQQKLPHDTLKVILETIQKMEIETVLSNDQKTLLATLKTQFQKLKLNGWAD
ncbi:MAG: hypothetical protein HYW47_01085 [Deltaproteobacteria bacterium]|nr:hypothetical protein [Deltaproteobacteria bacterium]